MAATVRIKDYSAKIKANIEKELDKKKKDSLEVLMNNIKAETPVDTGKLQNSIVVEDNRVLTDIDYAPAVEFGTKDQQPKAMFRKGLQRAMATMRTIFNRKINP